MGLKGGKVKSGLLDRLWSLESLFPQSEEDKWDEVRKDLVQEFLRENKGYVVNQEKIAGFLSCKRDRAFDIIDRLEEEGRVGRQNIGFTEAVYLPDSESEVKELAKMEDKEIALELLDKYDGVIERQQSIADDLGWSKTKTSRILNELQLRDEIAKVDMGRENVIYLREGLEDLYTGSERVSHDADEIYSSFEEAVSDFDGEYSSEELISYVNDYMESEFSDMEVVLSRVVEPSSGENLWAKDAPGAPYVLKKKDTDEAERAEYVLVREDPDYRMSGYREQQVAEVIDAFDKEDLERMLSSSNY